MKPNLSEFSYGYALTEDLIRWVGAPLTAAPIFPSLREEGKTGGYDVALNVSSVPLFLQFKLVDQMREFARTNEYTKYKLFDKSFYRMHLRPLRHSQQHDLLRDLESKGNIVYYAAPAFHETLELDQAYVHHTVAAQSIFIRPSAIGQLLDPGHHHVAFQLPGKAFLLPPHQTAAIESVEDIVSRLTQQLQLHQAQSTSSELQFVTLNQQMRQIVQSHFSERDLMGLASMSNLSQLRQVAYMTRIYFDSELLLVRPK